MCNLQYMQEVSMKSRINRDEREISISELWWYIISKWKWLVIGMVVGALLLGAFGAYKASANNAGALKEITMEDLTAEEQEEVKALIEDYEFYQAEVERLENNYLMRMDYNCVNYCLVSYYVDTDYSYNYMDVQKDYSTELVALYKTHIQSEEVNNKILGLNIEGLEVVDLNYMRSVSSEGNIVRFVILADKIHCAKIANVICESIENYHDIVSEKIGVHSLSRVSFDTLSMYSEGIKNGQNIKKAYLDALLKNIEVDKSALTTSQIAVYDLAIVDETNIMKPSDVNEKKSSTIDGRNVLIGILGGLIVGGVVLILTYITTKKIKSMVELRQVYNVEIIGTIIKDNICNRGVIKRINRIKTSNNEIEQKRYVLETVINKCKQNNITEIAICSTVEGIINEFENLVKKLNDVNIECKLVGNINCETEALSVAVNSKNIIFVEQINVTNGYDLEMEIDTCDKLSINILGIIAMI